MWSIVVENWVWSRVRIVLIGPKQVVWKITEEVISSLIQYHGKANKQLAGTVFICPMLPWLSFFFRMKISFLKANLLVFTCCVKEFIYMIYVIQLFSTVLRRFCAKHSKNAFVLLLAHLEPELELFEVEKIKPFGHSRAPKKLKKIPHIDHFPVLGKLTHMWLVNVPH